MTVEVKRFTATEAEYKNTLASIETRKCVAARFNGNIVSELTGLKGKALGEHIAGFKRSFPNIEAFKSYILNVSEELLCLAIRDGKVP